MNKIKKILFIGVVGLVAAGAVAGCENDPCQAQAACDVSSASCGDTDCARYQAAKSSSKGANIGVRCDC
jgi:hypothetical protein